MENEGKKKKSIWFREIDLVLVYFIIFVVGIAIVFVMTTYLNNKVKEFTEESVISENSK